MTPVGPRRWPRLLHRAADRLTPVAQPLLSRSRTLERAWIGMLDAIVAQQTDRRYLTDRILPTLSPQRLRKVLFVGVRGYTRGYEQWFDDAGAEFWTTDIDPAVAGYGAASRHVTGDVRDLDLLFPGGGFDLIVLNGIFGWGVDDPDSMERTLRAIHSTLVKSGFLLIGWNHDRSPDPDTLPAIGALFAPARPGDLPARQGFADVTHVYSWYRKQP